MVTEDQTKTEDEEADFGSPQGWPGDHQPAAARGEDGSAARSEECAATRGEVYATARGVPLSLTVLDSALTRPIIFVGY